MSRMRPSHCVVLAATAALAVQASCGAESTLDAEGGPATATATAADPQYTLISNNGGLAVDVSNGRGDDGATLTQAPSSGSDSQQWVVSGLDDGTFRLTNVHSGKVMDIANASHDWGARAIVWTWNGGSNQRWTLHPYDDGSFSLVSVNSQLCLDISGASRAAGATVQQYRCHGNANQRWRLVASAASSSAQAVPPLDVGAPGTYKFNLHDYGPQLAANKQRIGAAADAAGATLQQKVLLIAMAMQETTLCDPEQRDRSKDNTPSANISAFNLNIDMISMLGYSRGDNGRALNDPNNTQEAVSWILKGFSTWGIDRTLNFHRGGRTAFQDGHSYGAYDYRNAITSAYKALAADPSLLTDSRRVEVDLYAVF